MIKYATPLIFLFPVFVFTQFESLQKIESEKTEGIAKICFLPGKDYVATGIYEDPAGVNFESLRGGEDFLFKKDQDTFPRSHSTLFVTRYDRSGNVKWAVNAYAAEGIHPWDMVTDKTGNIIVCGNYSGRVIFNSTDKGKSLSFRGADRAPSGNHGYNLNTFIVKYSADGNMLWAKTGISYDHSAAMQVKLDAQDNIYVRAYCHQNSISFDTYTLLPGQAGRVPYFHLLILKLSPKGEEEWITYGGSTGNISPKNMEVSPEGRVMVECAVFENLRLANTNGKLFEQKLAPDQAYGRIYLDENGDFNHFEEEKNFHVYRNSVKKITSAKGEQYHILKVYDHQKRELTWGDKLYKTQAEDFFLAKINAGNQPDWIIHCGTQYDEAGLDLALDSNNNVLVSGWFNKQLELQGTDGTTMQLQSNISGLFVASFGLDGELNWAENCGDLFYSWRTDPALRISVSPDNILFAYGQVNMPGKIGEKKVDILGKIDQHSYKTEWDSLMFMYSDAFITQRPLIEEIPLASRTPSNPEDSLEAEVYIPSPRMIEQTPDPYFNALVYPNPVGNNGRTIQVSIDLDSRQKVHWLLTDSNGKIILEEDSVMGPKDTKEFSFTDYAAGVYFLQITIGKKTVLKRVVVL